VILASRFVRWVAAKQGILDLLNLEDSPKVRYAFAIERSRGVCPNRHFSSISSFPCSTWRFWHPSRLRQACLENRNLRQSQFRCSGDFDSPGGSLSRPNKERTMSSLNGDKSRYHRERKQKIARRKRNRELVDRAATQGKPVSSSRAMAPRSVPA